MFAHPILECPLPLAGKRLGGGDCSADFAIMGALRMRADGVGCEQMLGWPVTLKALDLSPTLTLRFPGLARGSWVPPPCPVVFWRVRPTHVCHCGLHPHGSHHQHCSWVPATTGSQGLALPPVWVGRPRLPSPPPGLCHPGHSISSPSLWTWPSPIHHLPHLHHPRFGLIWPPGPCTW